MADRMQRMTWGEFKAHVERDCDGLTDKTSIGYINIGSTTFLRKNAGAIDAEIDAFDELCIR